MSDARSSASPPHDLQCRVFGHSLIAEMRVWLPGKLSVGVRQKKNAQYLLIRNQLTERDLIGTRQT